MDLVLCGHKHVPHIWVVDGIMVVNSGTVSSFRLRGYTRPSYNVVTVDSEAISVTLMYPGSGEKLAARYDRNTRVARPQSRVGRHVLQVELGLVSYIRFFLSAVSPDDVEEVISPVRGRCRPRLPRPPRLPGDRPGDRRGGRGERTRRGWRGHPLDDRWRRWRPPSTPRNSSIVRNACGDCSVASRSARSTACSAEAPRGDARPLFQYTGQWPQSPRRSRPRCGAARPGFRPGPPMGSTTSAAAAFTSVRPGRTEERPRDRRGGGRALRGCGPRTTAAAPRLRNWAANSSPAVSGAVVATVTRRPSTATVGSTR